MIRGVGRGSGAVGPQRGLARVLLRAAGVERVDFLTRPRRWLPVRPKYVPVRLAATVMAVAAAAGCRSVDDGEEKRSLALRG
ncbi:hypothetical protein B1R27_22220 [Streptomyces sp. GKU 895]|nr:hypothetical protein B1R27_22220 [Streptomyces sp. GKU 895]